MSSTQPSHEGPRRMPRSDVRPLPARPNLEFERKQAKKLLGALQEGRRLEALARVHAKLKERRETKPDEFQLSDAQFTIAREYGFTSWPRLVEYFETLARQEISGTLHRQNPARSRGWARTLHVEHKTRGPGGADSWVPMCRGCTEDRPNRFSLPR